MLALGLVDVSKQTLLKVTGCHHCLISVSDGELALHTLLAVVMPIDVGTVQPQKGAYASHKLTHACLCKATCGTL